MKKIITTQNQNVLDKGRDLVEVYKHSDNADLWIKKGIESWQKSGDFR